MRKILFALFALLLSISTPVGAETCPVIRILDGDTLEVPLSCLPKDMKLFVRVLGIDTPEHGGRAKCKTEADLSDQATKQTELFIIQNNGVIEISDVKWDKFGGRVDATIKNSKGELLKDKLIEGKLAREYNGDKKKSWCSIK